MKSPYTVGAVPPVYRKSKARILTMGVLATFFGAVMNTLVRLILTVWLLYGIWHALPWQAAAYLTYVAVSLEAIVAGCKLLWKRPR